MENQKSLTLDQRKDLTTARESLRRAAQGFDDVEYASAASMLERVIAIAYPHVPATHHTTSDVTNGRPLVTCTAYGTTWYADFADPLSKAWKKGRFSRNGPEMSIRVPASFG